VSQFFVAVNRGKRMLRLDLKDAAQREQLLAMVETADVLVESFRPGVMDKLGLGWTTLRARNPQLVMCAISGYGQNGPFAQLAGHDINYISYAGMLEQNAGVDGVPALPNLQVADLLGGAQSALQGILAALVAVKMGGAGRFIDVSMADAMLARSRVQRHPGPGSGRAERQQGLLRRARALRHRRVLAARAYREGAPAGHARQPHHRGWRGGAEGAAIAQPGSQQGRRAAALAGAGRQASRGAGVRRPTKPTRGSQRRRLDGKAKDGERKQMRGKVSL
jgi:crotonobetainyl-CoA:carnitine CoA-transferase CaiB-like acyl-CoA transferase